MADGFSLYATTAPSGPTHLPSPPCLLNLHSPAPHHPPLPLATHHPQGKARSPVPPRPYGPSASSSLSRKPSGGLFCCFAPTPPLGEGDHTAAGLEFKDLTSTGADSEGREGQPGQTRGASSSGTGGEGQAWLVRWGPGRDGKRQLAFLAGRKT